MGCDDRVSALGQVEHTQTTLLLYVSVPRAASLCTGALVPPSGYTDRTSDLVPPLIPSQPLGKFTIKIMLARKPLQCQSAIT